MRGTDIAAKGGRRLMGLLEKYKFVLLVLLAGILLLLLPTFEGGDGTGGAGGTDPPSELAFDLEGLEKKLSDTLSEVEWSPRVPAGRRLCRFSRYIRSFKALWWSAPGEATRRYGSSWWRRFLP